MKNWNKILSLILVAVMSFTMVACNSKKTPTPEADTEIEDSEPTEGTEDGTTKPEGDTENNGSGENKNDGVFLAVV